MHYKNINAIKKTCDPSERARINAKIQIANICLTSIAERKPLSQNILDIWQVEYQSFNVFKKGTFFLSRLLDNALMKNIKKLMEYQSHNSITPCIEQAPPPYAPSFVEDLSAVQTGAPLFISGPTVAPSSFLAPAESIESPKVKENELTLDVVEKQSVAKPSFFYEKPPTKAKVETKKRVALVT